MTDNSGVDRCKFITYQFIYSYDNQKGCFRIHNDIQSYTVSELIWDFIEEYDIYNMTINDLQTVRITTDPLTGQEQIEEEEIIKPPNFGKRGGPPPRTFDVSRLGEYVSTTS